METTKTISSGLAVFALALAIGSVPFDGCAPSQEERERAELEKARAEEAAAVRPEAMSLRRLAAGGESGDFNTSEFAGKPWLLLAFRGSDPVCLDAIGEWNELAARLGQRGGGLLAVLTDAEGDAATAPEPLLAASFPVCAATRAEVDALAALAPMAVNPTAYLFDASGKCVRTTAGFVRPEHHVEDVEALLAGRPLPEHPAQGVLPEENDP